jgi:acyl carrier protein
MTTTDSAVNELREKVKTIVCEILEIEPDEITGTSMFKDDHDADSMSVIEVLSALERSLGVDIDQAELARMVNLDGVLEVVAEVVVKK